MTSKTPQKIKEGEEGIYGRCETCGQPVYTHMTENMELFDQFKMCGSCITGESAVYLDEL